MINPSPAYTIAPASRADIDGIDRIEQQSFATPWSKDLLRAAILNSQYRVQALCTSEDGVLGFYIAHAVKNRSNLDNLAMAAWTRGRGYGSKLVDDWISHALADRLDMLTLQVNTANKGAQRLYERFRFKTARLLVSYYPNGNDAYQMERRVRPLAEVSGAEGRAFRPWLTTRRLRPAVQR
ncbi:MAG: GNAT family N-acetyltransferase [SAR324 cluster bacterium]|nr:GNAT family N-acetyltransferase [SAR324 cluster bacterium]